METLNSILEAGSEMAGTLPLSQIVPVLVLVALTMIWGKYREGFWIGVVACLIITVKSSGNVVVALMSADAVGPIGVIFLGMTTALFALFTIVQQGD